MKILTVIGARPQFIKAAPLSLELKKQNINEVLVHTGQHFDSNMSEVFFSQMGIPKPLYNLNINSLPHGAMVGRMLEQLEQIMITEVPDWVLVYGDTNSTLAAAIAAKKLNIKLIHVEAGLRSFNNRMPEEINRILTDRISDLLFCPTETALQNLNNEGFDNLPSRKIISGDVMLDAAMLFSNNLVNETIIPTPYIMVTIHRAENTNDGERLSSIFKALDRISQEMGILIILHPRTKAKMKEHNVIPGARIKIIDPVGYEENMALLKNSELLLTDSGGMQKEAFFMKKKCVTLRDETEWVELVDHGYNILAGANEELIVKSTLGMLNSEVDFTHDFYGSGKACETIVQEIINYKE